MKKSYHHGELRSALLEAARARLRADPARDLSLRELARDAGVSPHAPYRHFETKAALHHAIAALGYRELAGMAELAARSGQPLDRLAEGYLRAGREEPTLLRLVSEARIDPGQESSDLALARDEWFAALVALLESAGARGATAELYRRAGMLWATLVGVTQIRIHGAAGLLPDDLQPDVATMAKAVAGVR
ncbi:MAG: WHG domain-containing protein [Gemmatimonadota bacterium]